MNKNQVINVTLTYDKQIQELNKKYLKRDYPTDVLSFTLNVPNENGDTVLGDIVVNVEQAKRQMSQFDNTYEEEIAELVAHGVLHLLGVHHPDDDAHTVHGLPVSESPQTNLELPTKLNNSHNPNSKRFKKQASNVDGLESTL